MIVYGSWGVAKPTRVSIVAIRAPVRRIGEAEEVNF